MTDTERKPMTLEGIGSQIEKAERAFLRVNQAEALSGIPKQWTKFAERLEVSDPEFYYRVLGGIERQFLMVGYMIALRETAGQEIPEDYQDFKGLINKVLFQGSDLYAQILSPEAQLANVTYVPGVGRTRVWY